MIKYLEGTVFNAPAKTLVNTVNCFGIMGAGIALEFKLRYPEMFEEYEVMCENKKMKTGIPRIYEYSENLWIMNFPTKNHWRYPSKMQWIEQGLKYFAENYKNRNIESIAFPKLGAANGGLEWNEVKSIMEKYLSDVEIPVYICLNEKNEAEGTEREMLDGINSANLIEIYKHVGITKKAAEKVEENKNINRFWQISKIKGITAKSYKQIYEFFYKETAEYKKLHKSDDDKFSSEQLSLF
ncbi:macro domain-containing protein [Intestinibacter bartlettii]|uniref:macro domain-containing protein n=1 Tax=Intestinibacter bartlettii TaxID=261299 RepID=UPI000822BB98|nr:macro domain-containing protein [Intestinibacter bartlettii]SCI61369.1 Macro domain [uncultured Clostridium sp.]